MQTNNRKNQRKGVVRKPKLDTAIHSYVVILTSEENGQFDIQFQKSGFKERSKFLKALIFEREIKVVKLDKAAIDYYIRLTNFYHQFQAIGNNYNQTVRAVKANFGDKRGQTGIRPCRQAGKSHTGVGSTEQTDYRPHTRV